MCSVAMAACLFQVPSWMKMSEGELGLSISEEGGACPLPQPAWDY